MRFTYGDLQNLERLRITMSGAAPPQAIALAEEFNGQLNAVRMRCEELFDDPEIDLLTIDFKSVEKMFRERQARKLAVMQSVVRLFTSRIEVHSQVQRALAAASDKARQQPDAVKIVAEQRLGDAGLSGPDLQQAIGKANDVREAQQSLDQARGQIPALNAEPNERPASVDRIRTKWSERFLASMAEITGYESRPQSDESQPASPQWQHAEFRESAEERQRRENEQHGLPQSAQ